jgi:hypothetical protein
MMEMSMWLVMNLSLQSFLFDETNWPVRMKHGISCKQLHQLFNQLTYGNRNIPLHFPHFGASEET